MRRTVVFGVALLALSAGCKGPKTPPSNPRSDWDLNATPVAIAVLQKEVRSLEEKSREMKAAFAAAEARRREVEAENKRLENEAQAEKTKSAERSQAEQRVLLEVGSLRSQARLLTDQVAFAHREIAALREKQLGELSQQLRQVTTEIGRLRESSTKPPTDPEKQPRQPRPPQQEQPGAATKNASDARRQLHGELTEWAAEQGYKVASLPSGSSIGHILKRATNNGGYQPFYYSGPDGKQVYVRLWIDPLTRRVYYSVT